MTVRLPQITSFVYNPAGAVQSVQLGNSKYETTHFNARLQPVQIGLGTSMTDTSLLKLEYGYGTTANNGNVLSQEITVPGLTPHFIQNYTYDSLNRLEVATETYNDTQEWKQEFSYDRYGNRNFVTGTGKTTTLGTCTTMCNPTFSATTNKITSTGYTYDGSGNTTADPDGRSFVYDGENKQTAVSDIFTNTFTYSYDGDGKRVKKFAPNDDTLFIYDASGRLVEEHTTIPENCEGKECIPEETVITSYIYAGGRLLSTESSSGTTYLTADHLGTPRINTNGSGSVTARHDYMPFGEEIATSQRTSGAGYSTGSNGVRKEFAGYEKDGETGLSYAVARMQAAMLGRFSSVDPARMHQQRTADPQHWNLYAYTRNNPLLFVDVTGEFPWTFNVRSFISASSTGPYLGDNRSASLSTDPRVASALVRASVTMDYESGRITHSNVSSDPSISVNPFGSGVIVKTAVPRMSTDSGSGKMGGWQGLALAYAGNNPIGSPATPDIDVQASFAIKETRTKSGEGSLSIFGSVTGDIFPSTEAFIVDQSGKGKVFLGAKMEVGTPANLMGEHHENLFKIDMSIQFDKKGNFTGVTSGGQTYTVDGWNKKVLEGLE